MVENKKDAPESEESGDPIMSALPSLDLPDFEGNIQTVKSMMNVNLDIQVILGHVKMPIYQLMGLTRGSVIELDTKIGEPVSIVLNGRIIAMGDLVRVNDNFLGVTLTEIVRDTVHVEG